MGYGWFRSNIIVPKEAEGKRLVAMLDFDPKRPYT